MTWRARSRRPSGRRGIRPPRSTVVVVLVVVGGGGSASKGAAAIILRFSAGRRRGRRSCSRSSRSCSRTFSSFDSWRSAWMRAISRWWFSSAMCAALWASRMRAHALIHPASMDRSCCTMSSEVGTVAVGEKGGGAGAGAGEGTAMSTTSRRTYTTTSRTMRVSSAQPSSSSVPSGNCWRTWAMQSATTLSSGCFHADVTTL